MIRKSVRRVTIILAILLGFATMGLAAEEDGNAGLGERIAARRQAWAETTDAWIYTGAAGVFVNIQDTRMTPLVYSGVGAGGLAADVIEQESWIWTTTLTGFVASPGVPEELEAPYTAFTADIESLFLWKLPAPGASAFAAGGGLKGGTNLRIYDKLQNSAFNEDIIVSVAGSGMWRLPFSLRSREAEIHGRITVPLFSYVGRIPGYSLDGLASHWLPPWGFFRVTVETGLTWSLRWSPGNTGRLLYCWDFAALNEPENLQTLRLGTHTLSFSLGLRRL